jgi:hypothetical protein
VKTSIQWPAGILLWADSRSTRTGWNWAGPCACIRDRDDQGRLRRKLIFPRYHQLDCVRALVNHAREAGPGQNYLIQYSAGSGKSNSIAWLAHRLVSLQDDQDRRVFFRAQPRLDQSDSFQFEPASHMEHDDHAVVGTTFPTTRDTDSSRNVLLCAASRDYPATSPKKAKSK